jgi:hypothetical protein
MLDNTIYARASELATDSKITERVAQLRAKIEDRLVYTATQSFRKFKELQDLALVPDGNTGKLDLRSAIKAEEECAKLAGLYTTKLQIEKTVEDAPIEEMMKMAKAEAPDV